jgi:hypothetical protein
MADIIDERRMARIINDAATYRHIRQIILNNDHTNHEPATAKPESRAANTARDVQLCEPSFLGCAICRRRPFHYRDKPPGEWRWWG